MNESLEELNLKYLNEIEELKVSNHEYSLELKLMNDKLTKEISRQTKIIHMSDKRQKRNLDKLSQDEATIYELQTYNDKLLKEKELYTKIQKRKYDALLIKYEEVKELKAKIQNT